MGHCKPDGALRHRTGAGCGLVWYRWGDGSQGRPVEAAHGKPWRICQDGQIGGLNGVLLGGAVEAKLRGGAGYAKARALLDSGAALAAMPGVIIYDDPIRKLYPMPLDATGKDEVYIGRIREDLSVTNGLNLWVVSDNLRKGAALCSLV